MTPAPGEALTLAEILALVPSYVGALVAIAALIVSILAYSRSRTVKSETDDVARILAETLLELAKPREVATTVEGIADRVGITDDVKSALSRAQAQDSARFLELSERLAARRSSGR